MSILVGLANIWAPMLVGGILLKVNLLPRILEDNPFVSFSLIFIVEALLATVQIVGGSSNITSMSIRTFAFLITIVFIVVLSGLSIGIYFTDEPLTMFTQIILFVVAIILGVYLYGFRGTEWEQTVDKFREDREDLVKEVTQKAIDIDDDGDKVQL